jgi:L-asparaginase
MTVAVIFTGGTIASRIDEAAGGAVPELRGADILARTPGLPEDAVEPIDWGLLTASHISFDQLLDIARLLEATLERPDIDGAVVAQGTDTIEETSFALDLLVRSEKPIIVTGAMRNASEADYDGPRNLRDAVTCAGSPQLRQQGALVVLNGLIVGADQAVKTHSTALDTFQPRDGEAIGQVSAGELTVHAARVPLRLPAIPAHAAGPVFLVTFAAGMDGTQIRLLAPARPVGLVLAAAGAGNTPADFQAAALELKLAGTTIVLTTRCARGSVGPYYAFPGGGVSWQRAGVLMSSLPALKARIALSLALGAGIDGDELRHLLRA